MVTFGYGCVTATATGEVAVIYLADVGSEIAGSTTYHVVKAEGGSEESAVILALITASAAGIAIDYEGLKMLSKAGEKTIANGTDEILEQAADTRKIERTVENEIGDAKTVVQKTSYGKSSGNLTETRVAKIQA